MKIIGITGGIGSGKSMAAKFFEANDFPVYYADERAKAQYFIPEIKDKIIQILGAESYTEDDINKTYISKKIFENQTLRQAINQIIHPAVKCDFEQWMITNNSKKFCFKEAAILFESGTHTQCDGIVLITAPENIRIERIKSRNSWSEDEIIKRIHAQWSDEKKIPLANWVVENSGSVEKFYQKLQNILPKIIEFVNKK